jgi:hypothetical protein
MMTVRTDPFRFTETQPRLRRRLLARGVEAKLHKAGLAPLGQFRSAFPGQCADVVLPAGELLWKRPPNRF